MTKEVVVAFYYFYSRAQHPLTLRSKAVCNQTKATQNEVSSKEPEIQVPDVMESGIELLNHGNRPWLDDIYQAERMHFLSSNANDLYLYISYELWVQ